MDGDILSQLVQDGIGSRTEEAIENKPVSSILPSFVISASALQFLGFSPVSLLPLVSALTFFSDGLHCKTLSRNKNPFISPPKKINGERSQGKGGPIGETTNSK